MKRKLTQLSKFTISKASQPSSAFKPMSCWVKSTNLPPSTSPPTAACSLKGTELPT